MMLGKVRVVVAILCVLVVLSAVFPFPEGTWDFLSIGTSQKTTANPDWLTGWSYYAPITINNGSADYQTKVTVYEGSGTNGENVVYCGGHCKSDFSDLRFTSSDGETLLDYWIESITGTTPNQLATIWVENDATPSTTGRMYYGNPDATAVSNGDNTFLFFDHFPGTSLDTDKWSEWATGGSYSVGNSVLQVTGGASAWEGVGGKTKFLTGYAWEYYAKFDDGSNKLFFGADQRSDGGGGNIDTFGWGSGLNAPGAKIYLSQNDEAGTLGGRTSTLTSYTRLTITYLAGSAKFYEGGSYKTEITTNLPDEAMGVDAHCYGSGIDVYIDWCAVRKFAATEPSFTFGSEEGISPEITNTPDNYGFSTLEIGASSNTSINYFTLNNTGNCPVAITIQGTNLTGGDDVWILADSVGENQYALNAGLDDDDDNWDIGINQTAGTFISNLGEGNTTSWGLNISMPSSLSGYDDNNMTATLNLTASFGDDSYSYVEVTINVTAASECSPSVSLSVSSWNVNGGVALETSSNYSSGLSYFNLTNNSGGAIDITIYGENMTGGGYTWVLNDTATPGDMIYGLKAGTNTSGNTTDTYTNTADSWSVPPWESTSQLAWVSPTNIYDDDGSYASVAVPQFDSGTISQILRANNFSFSLTSNMTITGIEVDIERYCDAGAAKDFRVQLLDANGALVGNNMSSGDAWPGSAGIKTYGNSTYMWGTSLTYADINDSDFGVALSVQATQDNTDIFVDYIRMTVYYTQGDYDTIVKLTSPYNTLASGLADEGSLLFGLNLYTPTAFSDGNLKVGNITLSIVCSS